MKTPLAACEVSCRVQARGAWSCAATMVPSRSSDLTPRTPVKAPEVVPPLLPVRMRYEPSTAGRTRRLSSAPRGARHDRLNGHPLRRQLSATKDDVHSPVRRSVRVWGQAAGILGACPGTCDCVAP